jgi:hypothetical protein
MKISISSSKNIIALALLSAALTALLRGWLFMLAVGVIGPPLGTGTLSYWESLLGMALISLALTPPPLDGHSK